MFRAVAFATALFVSIASLRAQEAVLPPVGVIPPPAAPGLPAGGPVLPLPPPLPGQLQAQPSLPPPSMATPTEGAPAMPLAGETKAVPAVPMAAAKPGSSTSSTGQFIIHGDDLTIRSALSSKCEDIAKDLRDLLKDKQPWVLPIVVLVTSGETARKADKPVSTTISQLSHGGFHIQVNVSMRPDLRPEDLRKELVRALLAERILRDQKEIATKRSLLLPDWLFLGVLEAGEYRQRARPSALFAAIFKSGKIFGIEDIIEAPASAIEDALSRTIYQTSCCALVLALLDQPEGGLRMGKFLNALATDPRTERELLNQWFPNFAASDASLNKWWALQLATLASPGVAEPLSPEDTLAALEDALILRFQAKPSELPQTSRHTPVVRKPEPTSSPAAPAPAPTPVALSTTREAKSEEKPADPTPLMASPSEEKRGFLGRLNPFAKQKSSDEAITEAIEAAAKAEAESAMPPAAQEESLPPVASDLPPEMPVATKKEPAPLLNRWFGEGKKEAAAPAPAAVPETEEKVKPQPKPEPKAPAKPAAAAKPTPAPEPTPSEPEAEKKPSNLNPMNWFRGGKKEKEKEKEAPPADASAHDTAEAPAQEVALSRESPSIEAQLRAGTPLIAMVYQEVAVEAEEKASEKKRFFGLFGKKKPESDPAEPEAPKKPEPEPKAEPKKTKEAPAPAPPAPAEEAMPAPEEEGGEAKPEKAKRSFLGLHLFSGDKKESTEATGPEEAPMPEAPPSIPDEPAPRPSPKPKPTPAPAPKSSPKNETTVAAEIPIEDYAAVIKRKDFPSIIQRNVNALGALQTRAAVLFRPIVVDYIQVLEDLNKGKTKGMDARLKTMRARAQEALTKSNAIRDLLDLHEANDTPAMSGLFEDYLKLPETIQNELPERTDAISRYLDALDKEFSKK
ncbi:hypothetical protein SAMN02745166_02477 [Prosthecobacter debontii]|uniref:Uncharacterized protein n=1 Tax=Prosthecobacter debontii TaxID=48467 RepID=A0A1T4Y5E8_9BACT|nr:hypothetical protein [Prosthecobacter debontii]SKA96863.1 hypothetical protein SAMN02745166_02477 [Prosthecobacter debontii]